MSDVATATEGTTLAKVEAVNPSKKISLAPGVYPGLSMTDYINVDAISSHTLMWMDVDAKHYKAAIDGFLEGEDTESFAFGRAFHCRLLEPELFDARYSIRQPCQAILKTGERKGKECGNGSSCADG